MQIVFVSNYFNHHQRPLSDALFQHTEGNFTFVETIPMREDRKKLGYGWDSMPSYVKTAYGDETVRQACLDLILAADVVIAGSAPDAYLKARIKAGKLIFRYSERPLKQGPEPLKYLPRLIRWNLHNPAGKPIYLLAASAYAPADYAKYGLFRNKAYRFGYFPEVKQYEYLPEKEPGSILWAGRFLDWKHPDDALLAAAKLRDAGLSFQMRFIGTGPMEQQLHQMTKDLNLQDCVTFLGSMKPEQVREHMERASIFLFTSDQQEGWGAVLNEAMNSGCAVVAGHAAGSVPFLVHNGENGYVYCSCDVDGLTKRICDLLQHPQIRQEISHKAYMTIARNWNANVAAERLVALSKGLLKGNLQANSFGVCSAVETIGDDWFP